VFLRWIDVAPPGWALDSDVVSQPTVTASRPGGFAGPVRKLGFFERLSVGWQLLLGAAAQSILVTALYRYVTTGRLGFGFPEHLLAGRPANQP
jgi:hypothetical protein